MLKGEAIFRFYLFKQREERKERRKSKFEERIKVRNSSYFFEHFVWVSSNPNLYNCDFNCFSSVCGCFEVV